MSGIEYRFTIQPLSAEEGAGYMIEFPDLPGCMADGATIEEAIANGAEAKQDWIAAIVAAGRHVPTPAHSQSMLKTGSILGNATVPADYLADITEHRRKLEFLGSQYERSENPLYVWEAISLMRWDEESDQQLLPGWCAAYLLRVSGQMLDAAWRCVKTDKLTPDAIEAFPDRTDALSATYAAERLPRILGVVLGSGRNHFLNWASDIEGRLLAGTKQEFQEQGLSGGALMGAVRQHIIGALLDGGDDRPIRRRIAAIKPKSPN